MTSKINMRYREVLEKIEPQYGKMLDEVIAELSPLPTAIFKELEKENLLEELLLNIMLKDVDVDGLREEEREAAILSQITEKNAVESFELFKEFIVKTLNDSRDAIEKKILSVL